MKDIPHENAGKDFTAGGILALSGRRTTTGDKAFDERVDQLVKDWQGKADPDLIEELSRGSSVRMDGMLAEPLRQVRPVPKNAYLEKLRELPDPSVSEIGDGEDGDTPQAGAPK